MKTPPVFLICLLAASAMMLVAQEAPEPTPPKILTQEPVNPTPEPGTPEAAAAAEEEPESGDANVRTWSMLPPEIPPKEFGGPPKLKDDISLVYTSVAGSEESLMSGLTPFSLMGYRAISPGTFELRLVKTVGQDKVELAKKSVTFAPKSFVTLIISKDGAAYKLTAIDETSVAKKKARPGEPTPTPVPKEIRFYQFIPDVKVEVGAAKPTFRKTLEPGKIEKMSNLPASVFMLATAGTRGDKPFTNQTEIDLVAYDSLSYVLIEDIYGRTVVALLPNATLE